MPTNTSSSRSDRGSGSRGRGHSSGSANGTGSSHGSGSGRGNSHASAPASGSGSGSGISHRTSSRSSGASGHKSTSNSSSGINAVAGGSGSSTKASNESNINMQNAEIIDVARVTEIERSTFPSSQAFTAAECEYRILYAHSLCFVAFLEGHNKFVGYIIGSGLPTDKDGITKEYVTNHYPRGRVLYLHKVVIQPELRNRGLGTSMMKAYLNEITEKTQMTKIVLVSQRRNFKFFEHLGFRVRIQSSIRYGREPWFEMVRDIS